MRVEDRVNPVNPEMVDDAVHSSVPLSVASARFGSGKGLSQEDMISFGFSARHWQQIEAGRPITVKTLLRISETFGVHWYVLSAAWISKKRESYIETFAPFPVA